MFWELCLQRLKAKLTSGDWDKERHQAAQMRELRTAAREVLSPLDYLINVMHPWVSFVIMPLFALANAGVPFQLRDLGADLSIAVIIGLLLGKPAGVLLSSFAAVKSGLASLPQDTGWAKLAAGGLLCGIGFTMALFIAELALAEDLLNTAKVGVLAASLLSAAAAMIVFFLIDQTEHTEN